MGGTSGGKDFLWSLVLEVWKVYVILVVVFCLICAVALSLKRRIKNEDD